MNKNIDEDFTIDLDILETEHGIFTSNTYLGFSAREVYEKWLHDLENPQPTPLTLEEEVEALKVEINELKQFNTDLISVLRDTLGVEGRPLI